MIIFYLFTFIGSTLGIIAFILQIVSPVSEYNKRKWIEMERGLAVSDWNQYIQDISQGKVPKALHEHINKFMQILNKKGDEVKFKTFAKDKAGQSLKELSIAYDELLLEFATPKWHNPSNPFLLNKYIYVLSTDNIGTKKPTQADIDRTSNKAEKCQNAYKNLADNLNRSPIDYLQFWK